MFRFALLTLFCFAFTVPSQPAHASVLEFFFPSLRDTTDDPSETLQAPFAEEKKVDEGVEENPKKQNVPLKLPHRATGEITQWAVTTVSDVMTFEKDYKEQMEASKSLFDKGGRGQYDAFLTENKIMNVVESGQYDVRSYVRDKPLLLNEGDVQGRYRWLYEVSLMTSYIPRGVKNYKEIEPVSRNMTLRIQVGRSAEADNELGLQVELWSGKAEKKRKKDK